MMKSNLKKSAKDYKIDRLSDSFYRLCAPLPPNEFFGLQSTHFCLEGLLDFSKSIAAMVITARSV